MNYILHESGIGCDKDFEVKNSKKEKVRIVGFSKKLFKEKEKAASEKAQQTKDYSLAYHVIGTTFFKEAKEDDKDILKIKEDRYAISKGRLSFTKGYLNVGNNEYVRVAFRVPFIFWILIFGLLILGICLGMRSCSKPERTGEPETPTPTIDLPIDGDDHGEKDPNQLPHVTPKEEFIEITVFPEIVVDDTTPNIPLYNSENNTVFFRFQVYENDTLLHETGLVPPGYRVQWNAKEALSVGVHELKIVIDCYDVETRAACDGATTHCIVTVE